MLQIYHGHLMKVIPILASFFVGWWMSVAALQLSGIYTFKRLIAILLIYELGYILGRCDGGHQDAG
jgi:hypothetical protein